MGLFLKTRQHSYLFLAAETTCLASRGSAKQKQPLRLNPALQADA
jgi:hypothetical protein